MQNLQRLAQPCEVCAGGGPPIATYGHFMSSTLCNKSYFLRRNVTTCGSPIGVECPLGHGDSCVGDSECDEGYASLRWRPGLQRVVPCCHRLFWVQVRRLAVRPVRRAFLHVDAQLPRVRRAVGHLALRRHPAVAVPRRLRGLPVVRVGPPNTVPYRPTPPLPHCLPSGPQLRLPLRRFRVSVACGRQNGANAPRSRSRSMCYSYSRYCHSVHTVITAATLHTAMPTLAARTSRLLRLPAPQLPGDHPGDDVAPSAPAPRPISSLARVPAKPSTAQTKPNQPKPSTAQLSAGAANRLGGGFVLSMRRRIGR